MSATRDEAIVVEADRKVWVVVANERTQVSGFLAGGRTFLMRVFLDRREAAAEAALLRNSEVCTSTLGRLVEACQSADLSLIVQRRGGSLYFLTGVANLANSRATGARGPPA